MPGFLQSGLSFLKRQHRDWKITVLRTSLERLSYQIVFPYLSIYIVALGATGTQLGIVNSIGMLIAGLCGPFTGWFIDRIGPKKIYLIGALKKEGPIPFSYRMTVMQALSEGGGLTDYAKRKKIYVLRTHDGKEYRLLFDYDAALRGERMELNIPLMPGDTVVVPH